MKTGVLAFACLAVLSLAACTTVTAPDGSTSRVLGFESQAEMDKTSAVVAKATSALPFPFDLIAGTLSVIAIGAIGVVGKKLGEDKGWADREKHQADVVDPAYAAGAAEKPTITTAATPVVTHGQT